MDLPTLLEEEVRPGPVLGVGSFCEVRGVQTITLKQADDGKNEQTEESSPGRQRMARRYSLTHAQQDPLTRPTRLAMKYIRKSGLSESKLEIAQEDFQRELEILKEIHHPHVIELHAVGIQQQQQQEKPIITTLFLTRIHSTLENLIAKWQNERGLGFFPDKQAEKVLWLERLILLSRIASAMECFHSHKILIRDMKPENIGMDDQGIPKLYDFGLAKRLKATKDFEEDTNIFTTQFPNLTGQTGTLRYMAPEVALCHPYNATADVHSMGIIMHQVLSLLIPFSGLTAKEFTNQVVIGGMRPPLANTWPEKLQELLKEMWHESLEQRPTSSDVVSKLEAILRGSDEELYPSSPPSMVSWLFGNK